MVNGVEPVDELAVTVACSHEVPGWISVAMKRADAYPSAFVCSPPTVFREP
jgi:hypothetical protein